MSGLIKISGSGKSNKKPIITDFVQFGEIGVDSFSIKYTAIDKDNTPLKHYLYVNGTKKDISKDVGADRVNREFTYTLSGLEPKTEYNLQLEITDGSSTVQSSIIKVTTNKIKIFGVRVDESNSNPESCVTYIEDAVGISVATPTSLGGWSNISPFSKVKLVGFKNGQETGDINPNDKTKYLNGETIPQDVDVMSRIPKIYWDFTSTSNGYELRISENRFNDTCDCYAHKVGGIEKDYIYVGSYLGCVEGNKLRSRSGASPTESKTLTQFRTYAHNVGNGYQQFNWFTLILLQNLYLLAYKNLNSQTALGYGYANGNSNKTNTGGTNTKGMTFGESSGKQQVCFLGIEDFYGNIFQWVDGMFHNSYCKVTVTPDNRIFNDNGSGFKNVGTFVSRSIAGQISKVAHTNECGYFAKECNGSDTAYYCDSGYSYSNQFAGFGGNFSYGLGTGVFFLRVFYSPSSSDWTLGSRLVFLG